MKRNNTTWSSVNANYVSIDNGGSSCMGCLFVMAGFSLVMYAAYEIVMLLNTL